MTRRAKGGAFGSCKVKAIYVCAHSCRGIVQGHGMEHTHAGGVSANWHKVQTLAVTGVVVVLDRAHVGAMFKCAVMTVSHLR